VIVVFANLKLKFANLIFGVIEHMNILISIVEANDNIATVSQSETAAVIVDFLYHLRPRLALIGARPRTEIKGF
jgi:hypothetical protein